VIPRTSNLYGEIVITRRAIRHVVIATVKECYGVADIGGRLRGHTRGRIASTTACKVVCNKNKIDISIKLYLKYGVSIDPVIDSIRHTIKYNVETFTGMTVNLVDINVLGIKG
jgi:uncharacterized alkaline shock family protein YloU